MSQTKKFEIVKALEIWPILVFESCKSVQRIKSCDQKTQKNENFFNLVIFSQNFKLGIMSYSKMLLSAQNWKNFLGMIALRFYVFIGQFLSLFFGQKIGICQKILIYLNSLKICSNFHMFCFISWYFFILLNKTTIFPDHPVVYFLSKKYKA